jgi:hypothetical protein
MVRQGEPKGQFRSCASEPLNLLLRVAGLPTPISGDRVGNHLTSGVVAQQALFGAIGVKQGLPVPDWLVSGVLFAPPRCYRHFGKHGWGHERKGLSFEDLRKWRVQKPSCHVGKMVPRLAPPGAPG